MCCCNRVRATLACAQSSFGGLHPKLSLGLFHSEPVEQLQSRKTKDKRISKTKKRFWNGGSEAKKKVGRQP